MPVQLLRASLQHQAVIENLMQFYMYDFSKFVPLHVEADGMFRAYPYLANYWQEADSRFPYLIHIDEMPAGFVLVRRVTTEQKTYFSVAEFFVMKRYRRNGIGKAVAKQIFDRHRGMWEVFQKESNLPAQQFWRQVISAYTGGNFTERVEQDRRIQEFMT